MVGTGESGNNLMYLPLDKLMNSGSGDRAVNRTESQQNEYISPTPIPQVPRTGNNNRSRTRGSN